MSGLLDVILLYDCNLACDYCSVMADASLPDGVASRLRPRTLPTETVVRAMRDARDQHYDEVAFTGGEPTLRPDLLALVSEARRLGFASIKLQTNGLLLASARNVERAIDAGVTRFHVSVHAHREARYDAIVRTAGRHALMSSALAHLVERGVDLTVDLILKSDTLEDLPDAIAWLSDRGIRQVDLWLVSLTDANRDHLASLPPLEQVAPRVCEALALGRARSMRVRSLHLPRCLLGADHAHAYDPGAGRVRVLSPDDDFELHASKLAPQQHVLACEGCTHRAICPGLRPDYLEVFGDREIAQARGMPGSLAPTRRLPIAR